MANVKVTIKVAGNAKKLYVCGSTSNLGEWDPKKAVLVEDGVVSKLFAEDSVVDFKVLSAKNWDNVEKGAFGEEVANHSFVAKKGLVVEVFVDKFNK
ncbi:MAG: hypothetical protein IKP77_00690 [Acholeplasmatales bacterium]|nr:hypothetical protein [Acholeplasmatales bacterium]